MATQRKIQYSMVGKLLIIAFITILFCNCKKQKNIQDSGKNLVIQNINILLDSVEGFDIPPPPRSVNVIKTPIILGLRDSITIDTIYSRKEDELKPYKYFQFILNKNDLNYFKSNYKLFLQKNRNINDDIEVLNLEIRNLRINEFEASVEVSKVIGISATHDRYYFKKEKGIWVFKKKINLGIG